MPTQPGDPRAPASASRHWTGPAVPWHPWHNPFAPKPAFGKDGKRSGPALRIALASRHSFGKWLATFPVAPGHWHEIAAAGRIQGHVPPHCAGVIVSWRKDLSAGFPLQRDYLDPVETECHGNRLSYSAKLRAPENTPFVELELFLRYTVTRCSVTWEAISIRQVPAPPPRVVRIATTRLVPDANPTKEKNAAMMFEMLDRLAPHQPDLVLFSENLLDRGVNAPAGETAETIPGPFTKALARRAKAMRACITTTIHERHGRRFYNCGFLLGPAGKVVGTYRKTHLPLAEGEEGYVPGDDYKVFDLPVARASSPVKVGMVTCWDNWFVEPARILRRLGAEIILFPLAGDGTPNHWEHVWRARAIDNQVVLVTSSTVGEGPAQAPSRIIGPTGDVLAETTDRRGFAIADVDLDARHPVFWLSVGPALGDPRSLYLRERRPETYGDLLR